MTLKYEVLLKTHLQLVGHVKVPSSLRRSLAFSSLRASNSFLEKEYIKKGGVKLINLNANLHNYNEMHSIKLSFEACIKYVLAGLIILCKLNFSNSLVTAESSKVHLY